MKLVRIWRDEICPSPREWDNLGTMVCWHRRYLLGDRHGFRTPGDFQKWVRKAGVAVILPLYLYDHGGVTMSTRPFSCPWDSMQVGWIYATKEKVREEFAVKRVTRDVLRRVEKVLRGEVEYYDQWLRGEVYGFTIYEVVGGDIVSIDSCGGFYGDDLGENGMLEYMLDELREPLSKIGFLRDGLIVTEVGDELEGSREVRKYFLERGLLPDCLLEKCDILRELCCA